MGTLRMRLAYLICSKKAKVAEVCVRGTVPIGELGDGGRFISRKACRWLGLCMKESPVGFLFLFYSYHDVVLIEKISLFSRECLQQVKRGGWRSVRRLAIFLVRGDQQAERDGERMLDLMAWGGWHWEDEGMTGIKSDILVWAWAPGCLVMPFTEMEKMPFLK